jgi:hypothetical protein
MASELTDEDLIRIEANGAPADVVLALVAEVRRLRATLHDTERQLDIRVHDYTTLRVERERDEARARLADIEAAMVTRWGVQLDDGLRRYDMADQGEAEHYRSTWATRHPERHWRVVSWQEWRSEPEVVES